jgi:hypothetical protein
LCWHTVSTSPQALFIVSTAGRVLQPGFGPLNWNSLAIDDFIASGNRAIKEFTDVVNQVCLEACWWIIRFLGLWPNHRPMAPT